MTSPSGTPSSRAFSSCDCSCCSCSRLMASIVSLVSSANAREPDYGLAAQLDRRAGNFDPAGLELREHSPGNRILDFANAVLGYEESDGQRDPVVRQSPVDARVPSIELHAVAPLERPSKRLALRREAAC